MAFFMESYARRSIFAIVQNQSLTDCEVKPSFSARSSPLALPLLFSPPGWPRPPSTPRCALALLPKLSLCAPQFRVPPRPTANQQPLSADPPPLKGCCRGGLCSAALCRMSMKKSYGPPPLLPLPPLPPPLFPLFISFLVLLLYRCRHFSECPVGLPLLHRGTSPCKLQQSYGKNPAAISLHYGVGMEEVEERLARSGAGRGIKGSR